MKPQPRISFSDSHAYPGCRAALQGFAADRPQPALLLEFSDGAVSRGDWTPLEDGRAVLEASAYATARGTAIAARRWLLAFSGGEWKVKRRLP